MKEECNNVLFQREKFNAGIHAHYIYQTNNVTNFNAKRSMDQYIYIYISISPTSHPFKAYHKQSALFTYFPLPRNSFVKC